MAYYHNRSLLATAKPGDHQREVDALQAQIRAEIAAGRRSLFRPAATPLPGHSEDPLDQRIAEELEYVVRQLEQLGGMLAADPILLHRHAAQLQSIDLIKQVLGHLGRIAGAADKAAAVEAVTLRSSRRGSSASRSARSRTSLRPPRPLSRPDRSTAGDFMFRKLYDWTLRMAGHRHADRTLALVSFAESSFFPIPPDVMVVPMVLARREQAYRIAAICTTASVLGGMLGYAIGMFLYEASASG